MHYAVALELEEQENFRFWVLAGGKPSKFKWHYKPSRSRPLTSSQLGQKVISFASEKFGVSPRKSDVWHYAQAKGLKPVFKVVEDGKERYVDSDGNEVQMPKGHFFIPSNHPDATKMAESVKSGKE